MSSIDYPQAAHADDSVWNYEKREARFVEVKGPGDSLSETQRVSCLMLFEEQQ